MGSSSTLGGPVFSPITGATSASRIAPISSAATSGRFRAPLTIVISRERSLAGLPIRQRLTLGPISVSTAGPTTVATVTLRITTIITVPASEASSDPGRMNSATSIESSRVLPANIAVRPAVWRVRRAASAGSVPFASSSRKRETISSA